MFVHTDDYSLSDILVIWWVLYNYRCARLMLIPIFSLNWKIILILQSHVKIIFRFSSCSTFDLTILNERCINSLLVIWTFNHTAIKNIKNYPRKWLWMVYDDRRRAIELRNLFANALVANEMLVKWLKFMFIAIILYTRNNIITQILTLRL